MRRLYLPVGHPKRGMTALRRFLAANAAALAAIAALLADEAPAEKRGRADPDP